MQFVKQRFRAIVVRPSNPPVNWADEVRSKAIRLVDVLSTRAISEKGQEVLWIEVASEAEGRALGANFPGATIQPVTTSSDTTTFVVIRPRRNTPEDQLRATLERVGPVQFVKDLPPSKNLEKELATPLKLAAFKSSQHAEVIINRGHIVVRGERLPCRPFRSGGPTDMPGAAAPAAVPAIRFAAWLSGIPSSYLDVDMEGICRQSGGSSCYSRRSRDGRQAMEIRFQGQEELDLALATTMILGGRKTTWHLTPPCLACGAEGHFAAACPKPNSSQQAPRMAPSPKQARPEPARLSIEELVEKAVAQATSPLMTTIAQQSAIIKCLLQRLGLSDLSEVMEDATLVNQEQDQAEEQGHEADGMAMEIDEASTEVNPPSSRPRREAAIKGEAARQAATKGGSHTTSH